MSRKTILIVEDEKPLNDAYNKILKTENYRVLTAFDGSEALEVLSENTVDLVLLDLRMPKMNGIEFLKELDLANIQEPKPIVIVFSNLDMQKEIDQAFELGATKYMLKAWASPKELVKLVQDCFKS